MLRDSAVARNGDQGDDRPIDRAALAGAGYSPHQIRWLLDRAPHRGLDGQPVLLRDDLDALLPDLDTANLDGEVDR
jgi:hypothetical protein